jgi:hypothetical protein
MYLGSFEEEMKMPKKSDNLIRDRIFALLYVVPPKDSGQRFRLRDFLESGFSGLKIQPDGYKTPEERASVLREMYDRYNGKSAGLKNAGKVIPGTVLYIAPKGKLHYRDVEFLSGNADRLSELRIEDLFEAYFMPADRPKGTRGLFVGFSRLVFEDEPK